MRNLKLFLVILVGLSLEPINAMQSTPDSKKTCVHSNSQCNPERSAIDGCIFCLRRHIKANPQQINTINKDGFSLLHYAARNGQIAISTILLKAGATIEQASKNSTHWDYTPLCFAVLSEDIDCVKFFLTRGAITTKALAVAVNNKFNLQSILKELLDEAAAPTQACLSEEPETDSTPNTKQFTCELVTNNNEEWLLVTEKK